MTTTKLRARRYRHHELAFDTSDTGHGVWCSCGWTPALRGHPRRYWEVDDAHWVGAVHLGRMAYRRLSLRGLVSHEPADVGDMWAALVDHATLIGDEARAVLEVVREHWPSRVPYWVDEGDGAGPVPGRVER